MRFDSCLSDLAGDAVILGMDAVSKIFHGPSLPCSDFFLKRTGFIVRLSRMRLTYY